MDKHTQDWGRTIGAGIVALGTLAIAVNLIVFDVPDELLEKLALHPVWLQTGRWVGLAASLGGGGVLLWWMLHQEQPAEETPLQRARGYTQKIDGLLQADPDEHQQQLLTQIHAWQRTIEVMMQTLSKLDRNDHLIQDDLYRLPGTIARLESQLGEETNALLCTDLEQMLEQHKSQQRALEQLQLTRRRAEVQMERAAAMLGTIYSQLLTYRSTFHVSDYQRLADDVAQEVQRLQEYLETLHGWRTDRSVCAPQGCERGMVE